MTDTVFAFDRDRTVDVNQGPVPLAWVRHLDSRSDCTVIAIGNQALIDEAGIDGLDWLAGQTGHARAAPNRERRIERVRAWADDAGIPLVFHVDDTRVDVTGVHYYTPEAFVERFDGLYGLPPTEP